MKLLLLALTLTTGIAHAAYDNTWYKTEFWSGEYPHGFAVSAKGVHVRARTGMNEALPASVDCELPLKANFHPWNEAGNRQRKARFFTASKIVKMTVKQDFKFTAGEDKSFQLKQGATIEYLIYGSEGSFSVRINGKTYEADQSLFDHVLPIPDSAFVQKEWVSLRCANGKSAWIFLDDVQNVPGIRGPKINAYGQASDLTDADLKNND